MTTPTLATERQAKIAIKAAAARLVADLTRNGLEVREAAFTLIGVAIGYARANDVLSGDEIRECVAQAIAELEERKPA